MRARVAVLVASLAAAPVSWPAAADGSPQLRTSPSKDPGPTVPDLTSRTPGVAPAPAWDTFSADVTIRRRMVRKDGTPGPEAPEMRYRWVRTLGDTRVEDDDDRAVGVVGRGPDVQGPPGRLAKGAGLADRDRGCAIAGADLRRRGADALHAAHRDRRPDTSGSDVSAQPFRAELEAVRGAAAAFKANLASAVTAGTEAGHAPADLRSREWVEHLLPTAAGRGARRAAFARNMGSPQGLVRGLERFVQTATATPPKSSAIRHGPSPSRSTSRATAPSSRTASCRMTRTLARASSAGGSAASSSCRPRAGIARSSTSSSPTSASDRGGVR